MTGYDALICPAMAVPPFPHAQLYVEAINGQRLRTYFHWLALAYGLTLTAHPVACIPCGRDHTGMPFGIQLCGRRYGDDRTLAIAAALEHHLQSISELAPPGARPECARRLASVVRAGSLAVSARIERRSHSRHRSTKVAVDILDFRLYNRCKIIHLQEGELQ